MKVKSRPVAQLLKHFAGVVVLFCLAVPAATAVPITYVASGPATGTLGGTPFTGAQVTVTGTADTSTVTNFSGPGTPCNNLTSVTISIAGFSAVTASGPNVFAERQSSSAWGFLNGTCASPIGDWLDQSNALAATYDLVSSLGPTIGAPFFAGGSVATSGGVLAFTSVPLTFQATAGASAAAPIPALSPKALLALSILLVGMLGFFLRRRNLTRS